MNFFPARSARRKRRKRSHCSRRTNCDTSVGVSRNGRPEGRTGSEMDGIGTLLLSTIRHRPAVRKVLAAALIFKRMFSDEPENVLDTVKIKRLPARLREALRQLLVMMLESDVIGSEIVGGLPNAQGAHGLD